jgi:hypothetical protein
MSTSAGGRQSMEINEHEYKLFLIGKIVRGLIKEIRDTHGPLDDFESGTMAGYEDVLYLLEDDIEILKERTRYGKTETD